LAVWDTDTFLQYTNGTIGGVAVDPAGGQIYWTDSTDDKIQRADLDGNNIVDIILTDLIFPLGIELDVDNGKIYWSDSLANEILRSDLNGANVETLVVVGGAADFPRDIALDLINDKIYWAVNGPGNNKIQRANLDGSSFEDFVTGLGSPRGVAVDIVPEPSTITLFVFGVATVWFVGTARISIFRSPL